MASHNGKGCRAKKAHGNMRLKPLVLALSFVSPLTYTCVYAADSVYPENNGKYEFDDSMLVGKAKEQKTASRFNQANVVEPGKYQVDLFINGTFFNRQTMVFAANKQGEGVPCFTREMLISAGVMPDSIHATENGAQCLNISEQVKGANAQFDFARLRLDVLIPQADMMRSARGTVPAGDLSAGENVLFTNYDTNYYRTQGSGNYTSDSTYLGLNSGLNLGLWQLRQQASYTRYTASGGEDSSHWKSIRLYSQRPLPSINSELTVGDTYTSGSLFSSLGFRGVQIETDDRMIPESLRGYAPTIRGIAKTTAKVTVSQSGTQIYQTTVAPGAFVIDDLYPTSYQGDLVVQVQEADGRVSSFTVPFSAVPDSMRPGRSRTSLSAGQVRDIGNSDDVFADLTHQRGLTNALTANSGVRISDGYQALLGGLVLSTDIGALGVNAVYSRASMSGEYTDGWRLGTTYSRTFAPTATTLALAGYRYSTAGYRDLTDVLGERDAKKSGDTWSSSTYEQKNQFVLTLNQSLGEFGQTYVSGSTSSYRGGRSRDTQYQVGYSNHWRSLSYNLSLSRQQTGSTQYGVQSGNGISSVNSGSTENTVMFSISLPLGEGSRSPVLTSGITHQSGEGARDSYMSSLTGTLGENQNTSYSLNGTYDSGGTGASEGASITQQLPYVTVGGSLSHGKDYTQYGATARGAIVGHSGGVTFGPYLGDTFALVEADGAEGAEVGSGQGAKINSFGYAIVPSLIPYSYNDVTLDAKGLKNPNAELVDNQQKIAPYSGAAVKVRFKTLEGYALLIKLRSGANMTPPLGANVYNNKGEIIGLVGQGNQIYARATDKKGLLSVKWGDSGTEQCLLNYDISALETNQMLYHLVLPCNGI